MKFKLSELKKIYESYKKMYVFYGLLKTTLHYDFSPIKIICSIVYGSAVTHKVTFKMNGMIIYKQKFAEMSEDWTPLCDKIKRAEVEYCIEQLLSTKKQTGLSLVKITANCTHVWY